MNQWAADECREIGMPSCCISLNWHSPFRGQLVDSYWNKRAEDLCTSLDSVWNILLTLVQMTGSFSISAFDSNVNVQHSSLHKFFTCLVFSTAFNTPWHCYMPMLWVCVPISLSNISSKKAGSLSCFLLHIQSWECCCVWHRMEIDKLLSNNVSTRYCLDVLFVRSP